MDTSENSRPLLFIISGPAGSGKTTLCDKLLINYPEKFDRVITATTRAPRNSEINGVDYIFLTDEEFSNKIRKEEFYEWANVHNNRYGTLKSEIQNKLNLSRDLLLNIDVQGAESYRNRTINDNFLKDRLITIFIKPKSLDQLRDRLIARNQDKINDIEKRLRVAENEITQCELFDACIESSDKESDFQKIVQIYNSKKTGQIEI